ncbi:UNVERIFIED_CONTAM: Ubiquitin carboxyl-terminal hydrolase 32, partial [Eudyptes pachyrhynchus]
SCLRAFTSEEELGENEMYYCSKCKTHCLATKKLDLWRLPPILIIHLKRFQFVNGRWIKSQKIVKFPRESFDPKTHSKPIYNLYAISCHSGILGGGHYVTYAKNPNCKWYCYNDSSCKELHPDEIDTDSAYILFY